ncbi:retrovirus-related pol polyprotein from transposon TNT 1-94 [Tanacetum coccineum]
MYLKKAQNEHPGLYAITKDQSDPANRLVPDREETQTLEEESRSKLNKDLVKPFDYAKLNKIVNQAWVKHSNDLLHLRNPTAQDMEILVKTCLMPLALKTQNDSFTFVHELKQEMHADLNYVESLEDELDELESDKAENFPTFMECDCLAQKLSEQTNFVSKEIYTELLQRFARLEKHSISLEIALQECQVRLKNDTVCKEKASNVFRKEREQYVEIQDLKAQLQGKSYLVQGNITINKVYYVEGLNHNLFLVGQFCDADLEVAFRISTCFVRDLEGNNLLTASPTQAWLWHRRLSHLNFNYINLLLTKDIVIGLPKLKYVKNQLCSSCEVSKAKRSSFKRNIVPSSKGRLNLPHMDLCGPMRVASINGKKYILKSLSPVISIRIDRGTEFLNKTLHVFFKEEGIKHQTSTPRTPEQNGVVERRNHTLIEAARTMLSASKLPLFFWAEAIATTYYTQNRSKIIPTHEKMPYHIINDRKPSIKHLHIFGCTCYLTRDGENLDKMKEKGDPFVLVGYSTQSKGYHIYNKRTRLIVESIHLKFDEIKEMSETSVANDTSGLVPQRQKASDYVNSDPVPQLQHVSPSADTTVPSQQELDLLFGPLYDEFFNAGTSRVNKSSSPIDNSTQQDTLPSTNIHPTLEPSTPTNVHVEENNDDQAEFTNPFYTPVQGAAESSSRNFGNSNMYTFNQPQDFEYRWTKDHPLTQVHGNPSKPVQTTRQLATDPEMCMFALTVSIVEPKTIKEAMVDSAWIEAMQEELHQFDRLQVWELVDKPFGKNVIKLKWLWKNKKDEDQTLIHNKAQLVAKGYAQEEGIDF